LQVYQIERLEKTNAFFIYLFWHPLLPEELFLSDRKKASEE